MNALLVAGFAVPLLMRRRVPLLVLVLVIAAGGAQLAYTDNPPGSAAGWVALNLALYSVAAHGGRREAIAGAVLVALVVSIQLGDDGRIEDVLSEALFLGSVWPWGGGSARGAAGRDSSRSVRAGSRPRGSSTRGRPWSASVRGSRARCTTRSPTASA